MLNILDLSLFQLEGSLTFYIYFGNPTDKILKLLYLYIHRQFLYVMNVSKLLKPSYSNTELTLSWLNLTRSLSQLKEDSRRRCSDLKSDPALSDMGCWTERDVPCWKIC